MLEDLANPTSVFVIAVLVAIGAQIFAARLKMPPILFWLLCGMLLGPFGLHVLHIERLQPALNTLVELGLAIILFEGGLNLNLKALKANGWVVGRLVVFGPLFTLLCAGGVAHYLAGMDARLALLFGALVSVGGPTVILPIVRQMRLSRNLSHVLTGEAMLIDVFGAILAIVMLQFVLSAHDMPPLMIAQSLLLKAVIGIAVGLAGAHLLGHILHSGWLRDMETRSILTLACSWGLFLLADHLSAQAGLLAMLVAGARLQRLDLPDIQRLRHFKGSLSMLLISVLFVLLAANLDLHVVHAFLWEGLVIFLILVLIARPATAWVACVGGNLKRNEIAFIAGMAPRGVVAAAIASLFAIVLRQHGQEGSDMLLALVYIVIIASIMFYSLLAAPLKSTLGITGPDERSVLIVGGGQMGSEIGRALGEDREVRFLDLNAEVISKLQRSGFHALRGNALDPVYLEILHAEEIGSILVMTGSSDHNLHIARLASEQFHIPNIYVALQEGDEIKHAQLIHQLQAKRLFAKPYTYTYWNDQAYRRRLVHESRIIENESPLVGCRLGDIRIPHGVQPIAIIRHDRTHIPHDDFELQAGDEIKVLTRPERLEPGQRLLLPPAVHASGNKHR
ncbi:MAG: sodium:proton antiporter [Zetaproteobacteria bacterium]|nr:MAG: sodium:proton antiporter [Zetaproteobacteria bacterium]